MCYLFIFAEYFWCGDVIEYLVIVFRNYGLKRSLPAYCCNPRARLLMIQFRLDFAIRIVVSVIKN